MEFNYFDTFLRAQKGYSRILEPVCRQWALTRNELDVVLYLANNPDKDRAVDIVQGRGMAKSHVSLSVTNLEARGLLTRQEDPSDRRTIHLALTERGLEAAAEGQKTQRQFFARIHRGVSPEEFALWRDIVLKISANIQELEKE